MWWLLLLILVIVIAVLVYRLFYSGAGTVGVHTAIPVWSANIEKETLENPNWRKVVATANNLQVVTMNTPPGESLGWEVHPDNDQFFRVESGECELSVAPQCANNVNETRPVQKIKLTDGMAAIVPKGLCHNVMNTGKEPLRMYTVYGPPHHAPNVLDTTHDAERKREAEQ